MASLEGWLVKVDDTTPEPAFMTEVMKAMQANGITSHEQLDGFSPEQAKALSQGLAFPVQTFILRACQMAAAVGDAKRRRLNRSPQATALAAPPPGPPPPQMPDMATMALLGG